MIRHCPLLLFAGLVLALAGCGDRGRAVINVSPPARAAGATAPDGWAAFLAEMGAAADRRVEPMQSANAGAAIEALRFQQTDMGWFDAPAAQDAVRRAGGQVFARTVSPLAPSGERTLLIVRKGAGLTLERIFACDRALAFGLGEPGSLAGDLAPAAYLFDPRGIEPDACFRALRAASAESNLYGVAAGAVDAAFIDVTALARFGARATATGRPRDQVEVIWASPVLPGELVVWRADLDPAVKAAIAGFLLNYGLGEDPEAERQRLALRRIGARAFVAADDRALAPLREMAAARRLRQAKARRDPAAVATAQAELAAAAAERQAAAAK